MHVLCTVWSGLPARGTVRLCTLRGGISLQNLYIAFAWEIARIWPPYMYIKSFLLPTPNPSPPPLPRRLLTDADPALRDRLIQVLFQGGKFQWARLTNLIQLARDGTGALKASNAAASNGAPTSDGGLDLSDTVRDAVKLVLTDGKLRNQLIEALTEDNRLHVDEVAKLLAMLGGDVDPGRLVGKVVSDLPSLSRQVMLSWADRVLVS